MKREAMIIDVSRASGATPAVPDVDTARIVLTRDPIEAVAFVEQMKSAAAGAVATFEGTVRAERDERGRELIGLDYSAYEEMAREQMALLRQQALRDFKIVDAAVAHRLGRLALGEVSVAVVVTAGHRDAAFEACRWLIDTLKADVPIWKSEVWSNGATGAAPAARREQPL